MRYLKTHKKLYIFILLFALLAGYLWERGRIRYDDTVWLTLQGYKSKGFEPYIKVAYGSEGEECKEFVWGLGDYLAQNIKQYYFPQISEDDLHYTIRYPMNFKRGGCEFWAVRVYVNVQEYNDLDPKEYPRRNYRRAMKIFDNTVGSYSIKYHKPNATYSLDDYNANPPKVDNYCYKFVFDGGDKTSGTQWIKKVECHPKGYSFKINYFFFEPFVRKHPVFTFNLAIEDETFARTEEKKAKGIGLRVYDEHFEPTTADFERFKNRHGIKE